MRRYGLHVQSRTKAHRWNHLSPFRASGSRNLDRSRGRLLRAPCQRAEGGEESEDLVVRLDTKESTVAYESWARGRWLLGLLVLQSTSSFVLDRYTPLIQDHIVITLFLTMLVGAGGNAGNQSAIKVIREMATGRIKADRSSMVRAVAQQAQVAMVLGTFLGAGGFLRVYLTTRNVKDSMAISMSLFTIVVTSVLAGTSLPFALSKMGIDPANAGTTIQVVMDVAGVLITCIICSLILQPNPGFLQ